MTTIVLVAMGVALALLGAVFLAAPGRVSNFTLGAVAPPDRDPSPPEWYVRTTAMSGVFKVVAGGVAIAVGVGVPG